MKSAANAASCWTASIRYVAELTREVTTLQDFLTSMCFGVLLPNKPRGPGNSVHRTGNHKARWSGLYRVCVFMYRQRLALSMLVSG